MKRERGREGGRVQYPRALCDGCCVSPEVITICKSTHFVGNGKGDSLPFKTDVNLD